MSNPKAIIADDEEQLRKALKRRLSEVWPELIICGEAQNGKEALALVDKEKPQVAFLDIRMPGISGMAVAEKIAAHCHVVFVTAYDQYAVEAFEKAAMDYLLKPVGRERLQRTADRLKKTMAENNLPAADMVEITGRLLKQIQQARPNEYLRWIKVQTGETVRLIPVTEVVFFKATDKYTQVMTAEKEFLIRKTIKHLARELDPDLFWQIHRSTIINVKSIDTVNRSLTGRGLVKLTSRPEILTVSRRYLHLFKQM
jgi:DNA-binding LytR/AlgR family response regulator